MDAGTLVVVEGIDGSGKSTVSRGLVARLQELGYDARWTSEPTGTPLGEAVRASLRDPDAAPAAEAFLFLADHANHVAHLEAELREHPDRVVVSDRYADSCLAYQGALLAEDLGVAGIEDPVAWLREIQRPFHRDPDLCILLDVPVEAALGRVDQRGDATKFEREALLSRVRANYLRLADELDYYVVLDATGAPEAVLEEAVAAVTTHLARRG